VARVLVTHPCRRWADPILSDGHQVVEPEGTDPDLVALAGEVDAILCLLTDRIDAPVLRAGSDGRLQW